MKLTPKPPRCCNGVAQFLEPRLFKALCDPNRIAILANLAGCCTPRTVSQIARCCPVNLSVVSRHLATLRDAGVLDAQKRGRQVYYSVCFSRLVGTLRGLADVLETCAAATGSTQKGSSHDRT